ncbi:MAG: LapA family protein [Alphaproteobacteria bacterium]|nr:LapA family protein [Alphaproteobacteria bacterium]
MSLLRYLINIPFLALLVWVLFDAHPTEKGIEFSFLPQEYVKTVPALFIFFLYGYIFARVDSWFAYYPLRRALRQQRKQNKALNKEQAKLNATVNGLKQNIVGLQEKNNTAGIEASKNNGSQSFGNIWNYIRSAFSAKKG